MSLFRKLFYRKPPDGLLEICERVYVFDCCFTTDSLEKQDYKGYVGGIVNQLRENYPDSSILAFNFREGETQTDIGSVLTEYDMTVMEYPRQYEGCPLLPLEVVHHFLKSSESWLSLGIQNLLLMLCERSGWPVLAFMLAALLIYRKHYSGELKTLDMVHKQAPRELLYLMSPLNPIPSQLRYLQYVTRRNVAAQWPPLDRALTLDCIIMRMIPNFDGKGGCRPIFRIYGQDPFSVSERAPKGESEIIKVDLNCHIQGDVVLECISLNDDMEREKMMFRVMFNTAFLRVSPVMTVISMKVLFSEMDTTTSLVRVDSSCFEEKDGLPEEAFAKVREMFNSVDWLVPKGDSGVEVLKESLAGLEVQSLAKSHKQQYETKAQPSHTAEAKDVSPLCAPKETSYAKTSPTSAPSQSARDAGASLDLLFIVNKHHLLPIQRIKSALALVIEDELSKYEYLLSSAFSAEDLPEAPKAGTPPTPPVSDLHAAPTGVKTAPVCGPAQPAPISSPPPPKESFSGGESTPLSGVGASPSTPSMGHSSGVVSVPCPPPSPQLLEEISGGGGPLCPIPPLHPVGPNTPPNVSPPQPPPPPAIPTTKSSSNVPSAPPPPHSTNNTASGGSLPGAPSPPPPLAPPPGTKGKALLSRTQIEHRRAYNCEIMLSKVKIPLQDMLAVGFIFQYSDALVQSPSGIFSKHSIFDKCSPLLVAWLGVDCLYRKELSTSGSKSGDGLTCSLNLSSVLALEDSALDVDQVDNLIKFCPTKDEMEVLKFFLDLMHVPRIEHKLRVYSFKIQFRTQVSDLRKSLDVIRGSAKLKRIMQTILSLGNALNQGTARGSAVGFRLDSLLKLTETRALNNKMTLMHYLCKVLSDKLPELLDFWQDLSSLEHASKIQLKFLAEEMQAINKGLEKVMQELSMAESDGPVSEHFFQALKEFLCFSEGEVRTLASLMLQCDLDSLQLRKDVQAIPRGKLQAVRDREKEGRERRRSRTYKDECL
ncbi:hypothetical protein SASPL_108887 [Salvia splendens]|uniref:Formin-like protein n=1 Tax=Salvia splendens TaxID=180675 RepID=A0A8X9A8M4_SALSN|nr:hypothetical protein SASPL_108887 [Salvia splendens]